MASPTTGGRSSERSGEEQMLKGRPATDGEACEAPRSLEYGTLEFAEISTGSGSESKERQQPKVSPYRVGSVKPLVLMVGPMFAGKTTELIRRLNEAREVGMEVTLVKAMSDTCYNEG